MKFYKFYADWCGPCRVLTNTLNKAQIEYEPINVDNNEELVEKYNIKTIPVFMAVKDDGTEIDRFIGVKSADAINALVALRGHKCEKCQNEKWFD